MSMGGCEPDSIHFELNTLLHVAAWSCTAGNSCTIHFGADTACKLFCRAGVAVAL